MAKLDARGHEILDNTPIAIPIGMKRPESIQDMMRRLIRTEMSARAADQGFETWEEANDFDVEDDMFPASPHELTDEQLSDEPSATTGELGRSTGDPANSRVEHEGAGDEPGSSAGPGTVPPQGESGDPKAAPGPGAAS